MVNDLISEVEEKIYPNLPTVRIDHYLTDVEIDFSCRPPIKGIKFVKIESKEIPYLNSRSLQEIYQLESYNKLFNIMYIFSDLSEESKNHIAELLNSIISDHYEAKYVYNFPDTEFLDDFLRTANFSIILHLVNSLTSDLPPILFYRTTEDYLATLEKRIKERISRFGIPTTEIKIPKGYSLQEALQKLNGEKIDIEYKIYMQGIHLKNIDEIHLSNNIILRPPRKEDFTLDIFEITEITSQKETETLDLNNQRLTELIPQIGSITLLLNHIPTAILQFRKKVTALELLRKVMKCELYRAIMPLYCTCITRIILPCLLLHIKNNTMFLSSLWLELENFMREEQKNKLKFTYLTKEPFLTETLDSHRIREFKEFVNQMCNNLINYVINTTEKRSKPLSDFNHIVEAMSRRNQKLQNVTDIYELLFQIIIGLETLYTKTKKQKRRQKLRERIGSRELSRRVAKLLGLTNIYPPSKIKQDIINAYKKGRNIYAHGLLEALPQTYQKDIRELEQLAKRMLQYLNLSIIIFFDVIKKGKTINEFIKLIENSMIDPTKHKKLGNLIEQNQLLEINIPSK